MYVVAAFAVRRCLVLLVALDTRRHGGRFFFGDHLSLGHRTVTGFALDVTFPKMNLVGEPDKIRHLIDFDPRHRLFGLVELRKFLDWRAVRLDSRMATHASRFRRKSRCK